MQVTHVRRSINIGSIAVLLTNLVWPCFSAPVRRGTTAPNLPDRMHFGNVSLDPGPMWIVTSQGDTLSLTINNPIAKLRDAIHLKVGPMMTGNVNATINQLWSSAAAGQQVQGSITNDNDLLLGGGGRLYRHFGSFTNGGAAFVIIAEAGNKLMPFVLTADNRSEVSSNRPMTKKGGTARANAASSLLPFAPLPLAAWSLCPARAPPMAVPSHVPPRAA